MSVFFTDSNSELWFDKVEKLNLQYISMPYTLEGVEAGYDLGKTNNFNAFFAKIKQGIIPKTSALSPENYVEIFEPHLKAGEDILYVHFSSGLSATFDFMNVAIKELKEKYPDRKITAVDTLNISLGAGIIAYEAAKLHNSGASDEEVVKFVKDFRERISVYFIVDSLLHLKRGGRISSTQAVLGTMLNLKPILKVTKEGKIVSFSKASGTKKALLELMKLLLQDGEDVKKYPVGILHANAYDDAEFLKNKIIELLGSDVEIWVQQVGPTVGTHCGPGTIGLAFHSKK